jgi:hypothetical protein
VRKAYYDIGGVVGGNDPGEIVALMSVVLEVELAKKIIR